MNEAHEDCQYSPGNDDACDPTSRAPRLDQQTTWNLKQAIPEEENACAEAHHFGCKAKVFGHLQRGVADSDTIEEGNDVKDKQVGQEAVSYASSGMVCDRRRNECSSLHV